MEAEAASPGFHTHKPLVVCARSRARSGERVLEVECSLPGLWFSGY